MLTYQLSLYQHKQIHANPTLAGDRGRVFAAQVAAMDPCLHLVQLILHINTACDPFSRVVQGFRA